MARLSREESKERTRERLLEAARQVFARAGYGGASVDAVAETAGFSKGAFYAHFGSKEAVFLELLDQHIEEDLRTGTALLDNTDDFETAVDGLVARYATDRKDQDWCLLAVEFALHAARSTSFAAAYTDLCARHYAGLARILDRLAVLGDRRIANAALAAAKFVAFRRGLALDRGSHQPRLSQNDVRTSLRSFLLKVLSPK